MPQLNIFSTLTVARGNFTLEPQPCLDQKPPPPLISRILPIPGSQLTNLSLSLSTYRHQVQGREQGPVRRVPRGAQAPARRARCAVEGGPLPRGEVRSLSWDGISFFLGEPVYMLCSRETLGKARARGRRGSLVVAAPINYCVIAPKPTLESLPLLCSNLIFQSRSVLMLSLPCPLLECHVHGFYLHSLAGRFVWAHVLSH